MMINKKGAIPLHRHVASFLPLVFQNTFAARTRGGGGQPCRTRGRAQSPPKTLIYGPHGPIILASHIILLAVLRSARLAKAAYGPSCIDIFLHGTTYLGIYQVYIRMLVHLASLSHLDVDNACPAVCQYLNVPVRVEAHSPVLVSFS